MSTQNIYLILAVFIGFLFGYLSTKIKVPKEHNSSISKIELKYFASFQCNDILSCKKGALCNSCWTRKWAIDKLKKLRKCQIL